MPQKPNKSTVERLIEQKLERTKQDQLTKEEFQELRKACRSLFSTEYGIIVAKAMMRISGIYKVPKNTTNPIEMGAERGKEAMYLFFIKGMLTSDQLSSIECGND